MTIKRFTVGFDDPNTRSICTDRNPGWFPIVDNQSFGGLGLVVALVDQEETAERICNLLNNPPKEDLG